jgi:hypothetical protein
MILLSSLMLLVAGATVVACFTVVACILTVAGIVAVAGVVGISAVPFEHAVAIHTGLYNETYFTIGQRLSDCNFFMLSNYRNFEYRIGEFKKVSDYRISDQGLNLWDYWISDSKKTIGCPPLLSTNEAESYRRVA